MTYVMSVLPPTSPLSGSLRGLGDALSYKCTSSICYAVNSAPTDSIFKLLQGSINYFAKAAGFTPIGVDGKIGSGTAAAAKKAVNYILATAQPSQAVRATALPALTQSKETVAAGAQVLLDGLKFFIDNWDLTPAAPSKPTTSTPSSPSVPTNLPPPGDLFPSSGGGGSSNRWMWYAAGGLLATAAIGGAFLYMKPHKPTAALKGRRAR
jgi:hypothetical protein